MAKKKRLSRIPEQPFDNSLQKLSSDALVVSHPPMAQSPLMIPPRSKTNSDAENITLPTLAPVRGKKTLKLNPLLLTIPDLCDLLQVSRSTINRMQKKIPGRVELSGSIRYHREIIEKWLFDKIKSI